MTNPTESPTLPDLYETRQEWEAWQTVVAEWDQAIPTTINDDRFGKLIAAINLWGERLAMLRLTQTYEIQSDALASHQRRYKDIA